MIEPVAEDAPAKAKAQAAYVKRFDEALAGPAPAKYSASCANSRPPGAGVHALDNGSLLG
ncbi:hypothetical protein [Nannocystis pusilla]|uniref:hypothetical protein n=1 Tax=Nannocystis pusilla TaxID=889268 RepID=UPI003B793DCE